jgi:hypothetical protein
LAFPDAAFTTRHCMKRSSKQGNKGTKCK